MTFGLGTAERVEKLVIRWPSGKTTELNDLAADTLAIVDEADGLKP